MGKFLNESFRKTQSGSHTCTPYALTRCGYGLLAIMHFGHYPDIRNEKGYIKLENGHIEANKAVWELERAGPD